MSPLSRIRFIGDLDLLPPPVAAELRDYEHRSSAVQGPLVNFAIAYSGQEEIIRAVRRLLDSRAAGSRPLAGIEQLSAVEWPGISTRPVSLIRIW
ncbi:undecaprenyl diphosphate synthase family protein [Streptomyces sp. NPDC057798]|uniref:undecaprenyl diphosphate synthase family protein n=1 Tax=Streptomyces sp. NPDC057798 TaxID=3346252 RepID=UPI003678F6C6